ncbi:MAG TPA: hypothetical protein VJM12_20335 [Pyrinomonadaceae bacterium]|nr:hypothetical protein [Pyrinomonadaceae bacterium]
MKRWQKIVLILLGLVVLSQIPFAYRRYQLGRLHAAIESLESQRQQPASDGVIEYRGVVHVHSFLGGHSSGTFEEIIAGAKSNRLDFVVMTEHPARDLNTADLTLKGIHNNVLFVNGNEVKTRSGDRMLLVPGDRLASKDSDWTTSEVLKRRESGLEFVAYPEDFTSWGASGLTGVEVYNVFTNTRTISPVLMFFDTVWSYSSYPDLLFATFYERPGESLRRWDKAILTKGERLVAIAGNDAHANVGFGLSGESLLRVRLDPYERSFKLVRVHVLVGTAGDSTATPQINPDQASSGQLNDQALLGAIAEGHCFIGFDLFGDTTGFRFTAQDANERKIMGDEIKLDGEVRLTASVPVPARVVLFKDGVAIKDDWSVKSLEFVAKEKGSYRIEVYLSQLPGRVKDQPWIISNPIYVR